MNRTSAIEELFFNNCGKDKNAPKKQAKFRKKCLFLSIDLCKLWKFLVKYWQPYYYIVLFYHPNQLGLERDRLF